MSDLAVQRDAWRLVTTWDADPAFAMGLDEAFLEGGVRPTLRLYTWQPSALSLGYFQKLADVPAAGEVPHVVRRLTGGGAIHHEAELTFSLSAPLSNELYRGPVAPSYDRVHGVVIAALARTGISATLTSERAGTLHSDAPSTGMCFHASTPQDIAWGQAKGVGSAQRRRGGRILHHGSIKLGTTRHEGPIATTEGAGITISAADLGAHLAAAFEAHWAPLEQGDPTPDELTRAAALGPRYLDADWVARR